MTETQNTKCKGHFLCKRRPVIDDLCEFHLPADHTKALTRDAYNALLIKEVKEAASNKNGIFELHWHGFNFPKDHVLFDFGIFDEVKDRLAKCWFNIEQSNIQNIRVGMYQIYQLILPEAIVYGETMIPVIDINRINIRKTRFLGKFHCASRTSDFYAQGAIFDGDFSFAASISKLANFSGCRFNQPCIFHGTTGPVFGIDGEDGFKVVGFDNCIFGNPTQTIFQDVDLRKASFKSISLIGVKFYSTNFHQNELNRNGLYNEVEELRGSKNINHHLIHEYRQLRIAMEDSKDYAKAHDFYIGEMEARQRQEWSFILWLYRFSSYYGINYGRALKVLVGLFLLHILLTVFISTNCHAYKLIYGPDITAAWGRLGDIILHSLGTGTLQKVGLLELTSSLQKFVDIVFRLFIPAQAAMFVLALRNKTKR